MKISIIAENLLTFSMQIKKWVHCLFSSPKIVKILTHLPKKGFLGKFGDHARMIDKCNETFKENVHVFAPLSTKIYDEDKFQGQSLEIDGCATNSFSTDIQFITDDPLKAARELRKKVSYGGCIYPGEGSELLLREKEAGRIGILNSRQDADMNFFSNLSYSIDPKFNPHLYGSKEDFIPTFGAVISKRVSFIDQPEKVDFFDVITSAPPDLRKGSSAECNEIRQEYLRSKIKAIFASALKANIDNIVLGAYGCGRFKNSPAEVAIIFKEVLTSEQYLNKFQNIIFAIPDPAKKDIFERVFSG